MEIKTKYKRTASYMNSMKIETTVVSCHYFICPCNKNELHMYGV